MNAPGRPAAASLPEPSTIPESGWHVSHFFYRFRRDLIDENISGSVRQQFLSALDPASNGDPQRCASYWVSGHEADFGIMVMDPDPQKVDSIHQQIMAPGFGRYVEPAWSFVSMSEVSEYVPSIEEYRGRLIRGGEDPDSPGLAAKVAGVRTAIADDERATAASRFSRLAVGVFLSDEQEPRAGCELVH